MSTHNTHAYASEYAYTFTENSIIETNMWKPDQENIGQDLGVL